MFCSHKRINLFTLYFFEGRRVRWQTMPLFQSYCLAHGDSFSQHYVILNSTPSPIYSMGVPTAPVLAKAGHMTQRDIELVSLETRNWNEEGLFCSRLQAPLCTLSLQERISRQREKNKRAAQSERDPRGNLTLQKRTENSLCLAFQVFPVPSLVPRDPSTSFPRLSRIPWT